jgi:TniQ protein
MSSWLGRVAPLYGLSVKDLLKHNLDLLDVPWDVDGDPPARMLAALADRTGVELARLQTLTLAGWQPWLFDMWYVRDWDEQALFDTYVRDNSVLLEPVSMS